MIWGANSFGYLEAGLPNIKGWAGPWGANEMQQGTEAFSYRISHISGGTQPADFSGSTLTVDASLSSSIYKNNVTTVQPPSIKIRVKTRYK